jgi:flagellin
VPNTIGGISVAGNLLANTALLNTNRNQAALAELAGQLSSGLRVTSAHDDPSGLAIATKLQNQAVAFDTSNFNVQDATNAATVADGALSTVAAILQRVRSLAIEAASTITSLTDRQALQKEVAQLLQEINTISAGTNFNGQALLDGSHAGYQPAAAYAITITSNAQLATYNTFLQTSQLIASYAVSTASSIPEGTLELQVVQINATQQALMESFYVPSLGTYSSFVLPVGTTIVGNAAFTLSVNASLTAGDVGMTAFVKTSQYVAANSNPQGPAFQFQAGANEGATIQVGLVSVSTSSLRIANINLATVTLINGTPSTPVAVLAAQDAIGQIDLAIAQVNGARAALGATISRLQNAARNNSIASVNLTASESAILDLNVGRATSEYNKDRILIQIGTTVLAQSNTNAQSVLGLFR